MIGKFHVAVFCLVILMGSVASLFFIFDEEGNFKVFNEGVDKIEGLSESSIVNEDINASSSRVDFLGMSYRTNTNGVIQIVSASSTITYMGFAITGKFNGSREVYTSEDFRWDWSKDHVNKNMSAVNLTSDEDYNISYNVWNYSATNGNNKFPWKQEWIFDPYGTPKVTHTITNNLGGNITNGTFWYIFTIPEGTVTRHNKVNRVLDRGNTIHLKGNFNNLPKYIDLGAVEFRYEDLVENGFTISELYLGDGEIIGHPEKTIVAIGVTKNNGLFPNGRTVVLDPSTTGQKSPADTDNSAWSNPDNIISSDNNYARETTAGDTMESLNFSLNIPDEAIITGILIRAEAAGNPCGGGGS